ncbi:MAG: serine O-acetyltransferase [Pseudomonadota bacterium]
MTSIPKVETRADVRESSVERADAVAVVDPLWTALLQDAKAMIAAEPSLAVLVTAAILNETSLEKAVAHRVAGRLDHPYVPANLIQQAFAEALEDDPEIRKGIRADIVAVRERDPACSRVIEPVLYFKGFHALQSHRLAHWLWRKGRKDFALYLQSRASAVFGVDMHPAAKIGKGIMFDHATGIVVGETAEIADEVSILHTVTLGGSGKEGGDRHPKVGFGVLIGAGAKILGNIRIGACSRIAAGSVVLKDVPKAVTVAGVPAKVVGEAGCTEPALSMDQLLHDERYLGEGI